MTPGSELQHVNQPHYCSNACWLVTVQHTALLLTNTVYNKDISFDPPVNTSCRGDLLKFRDAPSCSLSQRTKGPKQERAFCTRMVHLTAEEPKQTMTQAESFYLPPRDSVRLRSEGASGRE